jgi:hypothetical protein
MNNGTRSVILFASAALCAAGWVSVANDHISGRALAIEQSINVDPQTGYEFASTDLHPFTFAQLEEIVRADAATRFPNTRIELGSVKAEHGTLSMTVVFFGPNRQAQAFIYAFLPEKRSWKIASSRRLWFVSPSQIARGLRV